MEARRPNPRATLAAFLSFLFPGLGQAYNGEALLGWLLAVPMLLIVLGGIAAVALARSDLFALLLDVRFLIGLIVLDLTLLGWRLVAIAQAHGRHEPANARRWTTYVTGALVFVTLLMHIVPAWYAVKAIDTLGAVAREGSGIEHGPLAVGGAASPLPEPSDQPEVTHGERVNVLLVGLDSARGPGAELTDSMLVVSLDSDTGDSAMISIPRDLYGAPLPDGRTYDDKLNSLMVVAAQRPDEFPLGGVGTLKATIGELLGERIHYFAAIDLGGFKQAIDAIGGVEVTVERGIYDPFYADPDSGQIIGLAIDPGTYHMNGEFALAYVRSRQGEGDSDFTRAERQQQLLTALRAKLTAGNLVLGLPGLLDAVKNTITTDIPGARLSALAAAVQDADTERLERAVIQPPDYVTPASDPVAGYILHPNLEAIQELADEILADASHQAP